MARRSLAKKTPVRCPDFHLDTGKMCVPRASVKTKGPQVGTVQEAGSKRSRTRSCNFKTCQGMQGAEGNTLFSDFGQNLI